MTSILKHLTLKATPPSPFNNNQTKQRISLISQPLLLFFILFTVSTTVFAQENPIGNELSGVWLFSKAEFTTYKYGDNTPLDVKTVDKVDDLNKAGFPFEVVFRKVEVSGGQLLCTLGQESDHKLDNLYTLKNGILEPVISSMETKDEKDEPQNSNKPYVTLPSRCTYEIKGNQLIFTLIYSFGDSRYNFPLEGRMLITLDKQ